MDSPGSNNVAALLLLIWGLLLKERRELRSGLGHLGRRSLACTIVRLAGQLLVHRGHVLRQHGKLQTVECPRGMRRCNR